MIPYDPFALHVIWFKSWRAHIQNAKNTAPHNAGYCQAAKLSQMKYVTELALAIVHYREQMK